MAVGRLRAAHVARVVAQRATGAHGFALRFRTHAAAGVHAPDAGRVGAVAIGRPPIFRRARGIAREERRVQRGGIAVVVIHDAEQLRRRRQPPVSEAARRDASRTRGGVVPRRLAVIDFLPHEAGDVVGDRAVGVVGVAGWIDRVVGVFAEGRGRVDGLPRVGELEQARSRHRVSRQAVVGVVVSRGRRRNTREPPRDRERLRVHVAIDPPAEVVGSRADRHAHEKLIRRRRAGERFHEVTRGVGVERDGIFIRRDTRARHRLRCVAAGVVAAKPLRLRLPIHLIAEIDHGAVKRRRQIRILRPRRGAADRVIVITPRAVRVSALGIEHEPPAAIGLRVAVDWVAIERPRDRLVDAGDGLEMHGRDVVVVIIRESAVATVGIEFSDFVGDAAGVVARIENRDAIGAHGDRAALEISRGDRDGRRRGRGHERQTPDVGLAETNRIRVALGVRR